MSDVQVVQLELMRVASAWGFGPNPEELAWKKLLAWAESRGMLDDPENHRVFGFNNPNPSEGSPNYGYEFWITVGPEVEPEGEIRVLDFRGGSYAVLAFEDSGGDPYETIPAAWKELDVWVAENKRQHGNHQWLEEHSLEGKLLNLYYPLAQ